MSARFDIPQYTKRRAGEPMRAYMQRANAKYDSDWAAKAREQRVQQTARLSTPEDQDDAAIRRSIETNARLWKLPDDDAWLMRARLAYGGPRLERPQPRPRQPRQPQYNRPSPPLNLQYPEARSLSDCESDSGAESDYLMPDCDSDNDNFSSEPPSEPYQTRSNPPIATQPLRNKHRREDEEDITNEIKRYKTEPLVDIQSDPTRTSSKRRCNVDIIDEEWPMYDLKRPRIQTNPPSPPTDAEPALASMPSLPSDDVSHETQNGASGAPERPARSTKTDMRNADRPRVQRRKRAPRSSASSRNDPPAAGHALLENLLRGSRITRRSGSAQLFQLDDRGRSILQRTVPRVPRPCSPQKQD
ncbi:hypothetical protein QBC40DRAFT_40129 [Triangularia verruculosa]|uniref:Uncharacterized protein n=1 Tax=Triangularia verruculosa TaxID=2587418 RepID=A0AAN7AMG6_9PEZI|nr:hypothetical protein QBC40DRAFT_40129 [Triangularia verruculosa]